MPAFKSVRGVPATKKYPIQPGGLRFLLDGSIWLTNKLFEPCWTRRARLRISTHGTIT